MAGYDFGPGLDQASAAYYKALAASQPSVPAIPGLQDAMGVLPNRQGDPAAFNRSLSADADAGGYNYDPSYILQALAQKRAWDQAAGSVAHRFDNQQPNSPIPPFSSEAKDYEAADATGRNAMLGLLGAGSPGIAAGIAGAYAQPHAERAYKSFQEGDYGSAAGHALSTAANLAGALPVFRALGGAEFDPALAGAAWGRAPTDMSAAAIARRAKEAEVRDMQRRLRNARNTDPANVVNKQKAGQEVQSIFMGPGELPQEVKPGYPFWLKGNL